MRPSLYLRTRTTFSSRARAHGVGGDGNQRMGLHLFATGPELFG